MTFVQVTAETTVNGTKVMASLAVDADALRADAPCYREFIHKELDCMLGLEIVKQLGAKYTEIEM